MGGVRRREAGVWEETWGCEKKRLGGGGGCPALAVAPAAGAPPVVPDPWALPKALASGALPAVPRVTCTVQAPVWGALCNKKTDPPENNCKRAPF